MPKHDSISLARTWLIQCAADSRCHFIPGGQSGLSALAAALLELEEKQNLLAASMLELNAAMDSPLPAYLRLRLKGYIDG